MRTSRMRCLLAAMTCGSLLALGSGATALAAGPGPGPGPTPQKTPGTGPTPAPAPAPQETSGSWSVADALRFWTPERVASATDPSGRAPQPGTEAGGKPAAPKPAPPRGLARDKRDVSTSFPGVKSVGMLFAVDRDMRSHFCSASSVESPGRNLMLTAGHCVNSKAVFVPGYDPAKALKDQPYGIWPVEEWFADKRYERNSQKAESDLDFAFARVKSEGGRNLQDIAGGNALARTPGFTNDVTVIGYPSVGHNPQDLPVRCSTRTGPLAGYNQMRIDCAGMWGGVSGGPWFSKLDESGTGTIVGNVGGFNGGGPDVPGSDPMYNRISYSPMYGDRFFQLYDDAKNGRHTDAGPYQQPKPPYSLGGAERWQQARLTASGDFTGTGRSDLFVVWNDGSATLHTAARDGKPGGPLFSGEHRVAGPGSVWKYARALTGGRFTADGTDGLAVRWTDGEFTQYTHVDAGGVHDEKTLAKPKNGIWENAKLITAGRYTGNALRDDLLVVWANGSISLYPDLGTGGVAKETQLRRASATWTHAEQIGAGEFTGKQTGDLMVRWSDGEATVYSGIDTAGLHDEIRIRPAKSAWKNAQLITVGAFAGTTTPNDVLIRWADGNVSYYADVDATGTHAEVQLVG
ncbi:trypsin-like peptidase domain-containing protein [Streptomyces sp. NPDC046261]|uniref:trypsin-like serine peptidase n=1 Tax=Streptomyces sp. NPDC046261 TaxID=3157200 RepID=UPI0033DA86C2